ncbi:MAG: Npt1/Npt2 family nucleotide transporter [Acidobacteriota bacterium]
MSTVQLARKGWLDRMLGLVTEVRPGEAPTSLLLTLNVFLLLSAYYIIKPIREALILAEGSAELKSYLGAVQAALFLFIVPAYGAFASRVNRIRLINGVSLFFISNLILFYFADRMGASLGVPFFLWAGIFNLMVIAQFWSFANDLYTEEQGKRLFAIVGIGSTVGAVAGSQMAGVLVKEIGLFQMMLVSAGLLCVCVGLSNWIHYRERNFSREASRRRQAEAPLARDGGFQLVIRQRYLLYIGLLTLIVNLVNTNGEYILGKTFDQVAEAAVANGTSGGLSQRELIGSYYANFQFWQNLIGALMQLFLVSRVIKYLGVRAALFVLPLISLGGYTILATAPILAYIRLAKILENSTDYSLQNTVRHALFLPTSREAKYKAKQAVDTFFWRAGDMLSGISVFVAAGLLSLGIARFALLNVALVATWLFLAAGIAREHRKLSAEAPSEAGHPSTLGTST